MEMTLITEEKLGEVTANMDCSPGDCSPVNRCNPDDEYIDMASANT